MSCNNCLKDDRLFRKIFQRFSDSMKKLGYSQNDLDTLKNNLEMIQVIDGDEEHNLSECTLSNSGKFNGLKVSDAVE